MAVSLLGLHAFFCRFAFPFGALVVAKGELLLPSFLRSSIQFDPVGVSRSFCHPSSLQAPLHGGSELEAARASRVWRVWGHTALGVTHDCSCMVILPLTLEATTPVLHNQCVRVCGVHADRVAHA